MPLRELAARRAPSSPGSELGAASASVPINKIDFDLPMPKRPVADAAELVPAILSPALAMAGTPESGGLKSASPPPRKSGLDLVAPALRWTPELLRDLPEPAGPRPRHPVVAAARAANASKSPVQRSSQPNVPSLGDQQAPGGTGSRPELLGARRSPPPETTHPMQSASSPRLIMKRSELPPVVPPVVTSPAVLAPPPVAPPPIQSPLAGPSDRTTPEQAEAIEQRMKPAILPAAERILTEVAPPIVAAPATKSPRAALRSGEPVPPIAPLIAPLSGAAERAAPDAATNLTANGNPEPAVSEPTDIDANVEGEGEGEPQHLPMGWIIGVLFILALLLMTWIAHRAGVLKPKDLLHPPPAVEDLPPGTLPRLP